MITKATFLKTFLWLTILIIVLKSVEVPKLILYKTDCRNNFGRQQKNWSDAGHPSSKLSENY